MGSTRLPVENACSKIDSLFPTVVDNFVPLVTGQFKFFESFELHFVVVPGERERRFVFPNEMFGLIQLELRSVSSRRRSSSDMLLGSVDITAVVAPDFGDNVRSLCGEKLHRHMAYAL
jgi:hypothetical protein